MLLAGCGDLPALDERTVTRTLDDLPGSPLSRAIAWRAAERGVGVRQLVDDNGIAGLDPELRALDAHPNFEVRLYNAFTQRRFKFLGYLTDFRRLNRRMHNQSLTADGVAAIIGGRNIGDEYFGASPPATSTRPSRRRSRPSPGKQDSTPPAGSNGLIAVVRASRC